MTVRPKLSLDELLVQLHQATMDQRRRALAIIEKILTLEEENVGMRHQLDLPARETFADELDRRLSQKHIGIKTKTGKRPYRSYKPKL